MLGLVFPAPPKASWLLLLSFGAWPIPRAYSIASCTSAASAAGAGGGSGVGSLWQRGIHLPRWQGCGFGDPDMLSDDLYFSQRGSLSCQGILINAGGKNPAAPAGQPVQSRPNQLSD